MLFEYKTIIITVGQVSFGQNIFVEVIVRARHFRESDRLTNFSCGLLLSFLLLHAYDCTSQCKDESGMSIRNTAEEQSKRENALRSSKSHSQAQEGDYDASSDQFLSYLSREG